MAERTILGLTEEVVIIGSEGKQEKVTARIDTGATSSSIDYHLGTKLAIGPITKTRVVKSASGTRKRPIVLVTIKMNNLIIEEEFTLADRSHMTYPVLIGQNILRKENFLVDPQKNLHKKVKR